MNIDFLLAFTKLFATYDNGKSVAIQAICYEYHNVKLKVSNSESEAWFMHTFQFEWKKGFDYSGYVEFLNSLNSFTIKKYVKCKTS